MKTDLVVAGYIIHDNKVLLIHHKKLSLWLPVGGHIEKDETPDEAMVREAKEEVGIDIEIRNRSELPFGKNVKKNLAVPFHVNVHSAGDHDHCCFFYLCSCKDKNLEINTNEVNGSQWFSSEELKDEKVPLDVRHIAWKALEMHDASK